MQWPDYELYERSSIPTASRLSLWSIQPPIQWVPDALTRGKADHSPPSSTDVKNVWSYTSTAHTTSWRDA
jgi:hypothetical protein